MYKIEKMMTISLDYCEYGILIFILEHRLVNNKNKVMIMMTYIVLYVFFFNHNKWARDVSYY